MKTRLGAGPRFTSQRSSAHKPRSNTVYAALFLCRGDHFKFRVLRKDSLVRFLSREKDAHKASKQMAKDGAAELEKALSETEEKVLRKKEYGKRKDVDGNIVDYSEGKRRVVSATDEAIVSIVEVMKSSILDQKTEETTEKNMIEWVNLTQKSVEDLLISSDITPLNACYCETVELIESLGVKTLISIYCSRGKDFDRELFKESLKELSFKPIAYHKIYVGLSDWRHQTEDSLARQVFVTPPVLQPLSLSSSNESSNEDYEFVLTEI